MADQSDMSIHDRGLVFRAGIAIKLILAVAHASVTLSTSVRAQSLGHETILEEARDGDISAGYALGLSDASGFGVEKRPVGASAGPTLADNTKTGQFLSASAQRWICDEALVTGPTPERRLNPCLLKLPAGKWTKIHRQEKRDAVSFRFQAHAGSAFDSRRGRLVVFGSDTHGKDWSNSLLVFDVARLKWHRLYPNDKPATYRVNILGIPVTGEWGDHPWAMHTFGAVEYDTARDEIVVSSHPAHMEPGRFTNAVAHLWQKITQHPTWIFSLETMLWTPILTKSESFFPFATTFDSDRAVVVGYKSSGIYELAGTVRQWRRLKKMGLFGYHNNAAYDSRNKAVIVFGTNRNSNSVVIYKPASGEHRVMPTPGIRPPEDQHAPMAFHAGIGRTVVLVDNIPSWARKDRQYWTTETWLYNLGDDAWKQAETARLPFALGMNYSMVYDAGHNILLLLTSGKQGRTTVWALRL